jgi:predicted metal-dependent HD superfamily phosphohydrolase
MDSVGLLERTEKFVRDLFERKLSPQMVFHNVQHTCEVVKAVKEIKSKSDLNEQQEVIVQIAAWFHDSGYCFVYQGHEDISIAIATSFLMLMKVDEAIISEVTACVNATRMPQHPMNSLQEIICDADMYHLANPDYPDHARRLRLEWEHQLNKCFTDLEWHRSNLDLLNKHRYHTKYGKEVLEYGKIDNAKLLEQLYPTTMFPGCQ